MSFLTRLDEDSTLKLLKHQNRKLIFDYLLENGHSNYTDMKNALSDHFKGEGNFTLRDLLDSSCFPTEYIIETSPVFL